MPTLRNLSGETFNLLHVEELSERRGPRKNTYYKCTCACGNTTTVRGSNLKSGGTKSCGCLKKKPHTSKKHGLSNHPTYGIWQNMKNRCYNENAKSYKDYGAKGITVCDEWMGSVLSFHRWAIDNKWEAHLQIDRKDNNGPYCPDNCHFVTKGVTLFNKGIYSSSKTGHTGVCPRGEEYLVYVSINGKNKYIGIALYIAVAVAMRNKYISDNGLPNKLQSVPLS